MTDEQFRRAQEATKTRLPIIHECKVDEKTGLISIESNNIETITVKYYSVDDEILFSRSPFVTDQVSQFTYVKPFIQIDKPTTGQLTTIELPEGLN